MSTTATATCTYRKTKGGTWAIMGPTDIVHPGAIVTVTKRDGSTKTEEIADVGKSFDKDGIEMVYGYRDVIPRSPRSHRKSCVTGGNCSSFGDSRSCGGWDDDLLSGWLEELSTELEGTGFEPIELPSSDGLPSGGTEPQLGGLQFSVLIACDSEAHETEVLAQLEADGYKVSALIS